MDSYLIGCDASELRAVQDGVHQSLSITERKKLLFVLWDKAVVTTSNDVADPSLL